MAQCDTCAYYMYDEDMEEYVCDADLDEDDIARMEGEHHRNDCPYWVNGDEYAVVRHQI